MEQTREVGPPLVADSQAAAAQRARRGVRSTTPPVPAQPLARLDAAAGDPGRDAAPAGSAAAPGSRTPCRRGAWPGACGVVRFAARADDGRDRVDQGATGSNRGRWPQTGEPRRSSAEG